MPVVTTSGQNNWIPKEYISHYLEPVTLHVKGDFADVVK